MTATILAATTVAAGLVGYRIGSGGDGQDTTAAVLAGDAAEAPATPATDDATGIGGGIDGMGPPASAVLARTAADGTLVRALEQRWPDDVGDHGAGWVPPRSCRSVGGLEVGLVTDSQVALGWATLFGEDPPAPAVWGAGRAGHSHLGAVEFVVVRTTPDVASVRLERDGVAVDEAEPQGGWAVVAAQGGDGVPSAIAVLGPGGELLDRRPADQTDLPHQRAECQPPPPSLPDSARPPTADDADAVAAIAAAYRSVFERDGADDLIDPRDGMAGAEAIDDAFLEEVREKVSSFGITEIRVEIDAIGFLDDVTAAVVFRLVGAPVEWTRGDAELVDGEWKVASQTWCSLVGRAGATCP